MEWLDGFEESHGGLNAKLISLEGEELLCNFGALKSRGLPNLAPYNREKSLVSDFAEWSRIPTSDYLQGIELDSTTTSDSHEVFHFRHGWQDYFVPALALLRGMFPLIPEAFEYLFTPRSIDFLCTPLERNGHWTVGLPDFRGYYKGRFRASTMEALTWASLFPSARSFWASPYKNMCNGNMRVQLPHAQVRLLPCGIRKGRAVYVTSLKVSAVLALEAPLSFAEDAPRSYLWTIGASPLAANPNAYYEQGEHSAAAQSLKLTDDEWAVLRPICEPKSHTRGRQLQAPRRTIADCVLLRLATTLRWADIATRPLTHVSLASHWGQWRASGTLERFIKTMRLLRPDAEYLRNPNHY